MKRYLCVLAVLAVLLIPDWASACWPFWRPAVRPAPFYSTPYYAYPPLYSAPSYPPIYVYPQTYPAIVPGYPYGPVIPRIDPIPPMNLPTAPAKPAKTEGKQQSTVPAVVPGAGSDASRSPTIPPKDPILPAAGSDPLAPAKTVTPTPAKSDSPTTPAAKLPGGLPPLELPKEPEPGKSKVPSATPTPAPGDSLTLPDTAPYKKPPMTLPGTTVPALPSPAPDPLMPLLPGPDLPGKTKPGALPSVTLPPEVPVIPESTSRSSPLTGGMSVKLFPTVMADFRGGVYRTVNFYNHTARDLALTIEGRSVKLPAKTYVETKLSPTFTWSYGDRSSMREQVPEGAAGLDVVFRDE